MITSILLAYYLSIEPVATFSRNQLKQKNKLSGNIQPRNHLL